jgi:serine protein kinase
MTIDLRSRLEQHRQEEKKLAWEGTFAEYFDLVTTQPQLARLSHGRIYDMIVSAGIEAGPRGERVFKFFEDDIYGLHETLEQLVEYFHSAAKRLEVRKRILLFMGPVGGGKSTIVWLLKRGLERYTRGEEGALYAIKGCPMNEEPPSRCRWSALPSRRRTEWGSGPFRRPIRRARTSPS